MRVLFLILLFSFSTILSAQNFSGSFNYYVDSLFTCLNIDTTNYPVTNLLAANVADWQLYKPNDFDSENSCYGDILIMPKMEMFLDAGELEFVLNSDSIDFQFMFLSDNNIKGSLYRIETDSTMKRMKLERIGTDINVNFGEVISKSFYNEGLLRCMINFECKKIRDINSARFFYYHDKKVIKEILITEKAGEVFILQFTEE